MRKKMIIFLVIFSSFFTLFFPLTDINSLKTKLTESKLIDRSKILNKISEYYIEERNFIFLIKYSLESVEISRKFLQTDQFIIANANLAYGYFKFRQNKRALKFIKIALSKIKNFQNEKKAIYPLRIYSLILQRFPKKYNELISCYKKLIKLYDFTNDKYNKAMSIRNIGITYMYMEDTRNSLYFLNQALAQFYLINELKAYIHVLNLIGGIYLLQGDKDKALSIMYKSLKLAEENNFIEKQVRIIMSLGNFFFNERKFIKSLGYYKNALKKSLNFNKKYISYKISILSKIGDINFQINKLDIALSNYKKALNIGRTNIVKDFESSQSIYLSIGRLYKEERKFFLSRLNLERALNISKKYRDFRTYSKALQSIGELFLLQNDFGKCYTYLKKSIKISKDINDSAVQLENYRLLSKSLALNNKYKKALKYHKLYFDLNNKIYNEKSAKNIAQIEAKYQVEKKKKENLLLKKENEIKSLDIRKQVQIRNMAILIVGLLFIILILIWKKYSFLLTFWKRKNFISHYKLDKIIGSGGSGVVYYATDVQDKSKSVALKVLRIENSLDQNFKQRFKNEGAFIDRFDHPNIVKVIERGESGNTLYLAMELIEGRSLSEIIKNDSPVNFKRVFSLMSQICNAIAVIHEKQIVHRDLKPDNIMVVRKDDGKEIVKLLDFGIAKSEGLTSMTKTGLLLGTIYYLAPEQINSGIVSKKSDIYSLGIIFYELITGKKPFNAEIEENVITKIIEKKIRSPKSLRKSLPEEINRLILNILTRQPENRPDISEIIKILSDFNSNILKGEKKYVRDFERFAL